MKAVTFCSLLLVFMGSAVASYSQIPPSSSARPTPNVMVHTDGRVSQIIARSETYFKEGELHLMAGEREEARDKFDKAVDTILESTIDVRTNQRLQSFYLELVERIYRLEVPSSQSAPPSTRSMAQVAMNQQGSQGKPVQPQLGFREQEFEPSPLDELTKLILTPERKEVPRTASCAPARFQNLEIRGFKLGMSTQEVKNRLPSLRVPAANRYGATEITVYPKRGRLSDISAEYKGVNNIAFEFLDNRLTDIYFLYDDSIKWPSSGEFISRVSEVLNLPEGWETYRPEESYRLGDIQSLRCGNVVILAGLTKLNYKVFPMLYWKDLSKEETIQKRLMMEIEKKRREEEERRKAFKP
jgi:hypothetical protein